MIRPREHLRAVYRDTQTWHSRGDSLRLDMNELVPHLDEQVFAEITDQIRPWMITAYPEVNPVYEALTESLGLSREHVVLMSGSDAGIRQTIETFCDPGDALASTYPTYGMYEVYAALYDLTFIKLNHKSDFTIGPHDILGALDDKTKVLAIANPNGALGCVIPPAEMELIIREASRMGTVVLLDEAYVHYHEDQWSHRIDEFDNLVLVRTFSKAAGLAGLRFGYVLTNPTLRDYVFKMKPVVELNSIAALFGTHLLRHPEIIKRAVELSLDGKDYLVEQLREAGFEVYPGYANFIQVKFGALQKTILEDLSNNNIRVKDQSRSDLLAEYTRITVGPRTQMDMVLDIVRRAG